MRGQQTNLRLCLWYKYTNWKSNKIICTSHVNHKPYVHVLIECIRLLFSAVAIFLRVFLPHSFIHSFSTIVLQCEPFFSSSLHNKKKNHIWINAVQINPIQTLLNCLAYCTIDGDDKIRKHRCWVIQMVWMFFFFSFRIKRIALPCLRKHQNRYNMWCTQTTPECCGTQHYLKLTVFVILILLVMLRKMVYDTSKYIENTTSWKDMWLSDAARIWCDCPFRVRFCYFG